MLSETVGRAITRRRKELGLTHAQLAERCNQLGWPQLTTSAISNIETGRKFADGRRRREVTVDELAVIARALEAHPLLWIAPLGHEDHVEILPDVTVPTLHAHKWFAGESELDGVRDGDPVVDTYKRYSDEMQTQMKALAAGDAEKARASGEVIRELQRSMSESGWRIPPLPSEEDFEDPGVPW